jgi:hypothetical protein
MDFECGRFNEEGARTASRCQQAASSLYPSRLLDRRYGRRTAGCIFDRTTCSGIKTTQSVGTETSCRSIAFPMETPALKVPGNHQVLGYACCFCKMRIAEVSGASAFTRCFACQAAPGSDVQWRINTVDPARGVLMACLWAAVGWVFLETRCCVSRAKPS